MKVEVRVQARRWQPQPFIVHACTSSQTPLTTGQFFQHIQSYFTQHPPPFRVILGPYPKYEGWNIVRSRHSMRLRSGMADVKFKVMCLALEAAGQQRLAKKLYTGWKASAASWFVSRQTTRECPQSDTKHSCLPMCGHVPKHCTRSFPLSKKRC